MNYIQKMNKIKAIIIDDEASSRENIKFLVNRFTPQVDIIKTFRNLPDGVSFLKENDVDVVFLDVEMPDYAGYEIATFFDNFPFEIIFITAYDKYAVKAFELAALDYLLKPVEIERLKAAVERFETKRTMTNTKLRLTKLQEELESHASASISIHHDGHKKLVRVNEILAIEGQSAYSNLYTLDGNQYLLSKNIANLEKELEEYPQFYRSHKSWLINIEQVASYSKSNYSAILQSGLKVKISRAKVSDFESRLVQ